MKLIPVKVDQNLREHIPYRDQTFPVEIFSDYYAVMVDQTLNCHWHHEFEFAVLMSGELDYYINDVHLKLKAGDCIFINSNVMHTAKQRDEGGAAKMVTIAFPPSLLTEGVESSIYGKYFRPVINGPVQGFRILRENPFGEEIISGLHQVCALDEEAFGFELRCIRLLCEIWLAAVKYIDSAELTPYIQWGSPKYEQRAKEMLTYIHNHYAEKITADTIARQVNISRSECFRCFKRFTNKNPNEYLNDYRLVQAAGLIAGTDDKIVDIGVSCGFTSSSYFGKLFKEKYGRSPAAYRQLRQGMTVS